MSAAGHQCCDRPGCPVATPHVHGPADDGVQVALLWSDHPDWPRPDEVDWLPPVAG